MNLNRRVHRPYDSFKTLVARTCERLWPGIGRYDRPIYGRVLSVQELAGTVTVTNKLWSCDIQPLTLDLENDSSRPKIKDVPIDPIQINASGVALFPKPFKGMVVRVAWMGGSRAHPFIQSFTAEGMTVPLADTGELSDLLYQAVQLLMQPRVTAVGPGPYDAATMAKIVLLLQRIPT
jgi:hypothetical protein